MTSAQAMIEATTRTPKGGSSELVCSTGPVTVVEARATVTVRTPDGVRRLAVR